MDSAVFQHFRPEERPFIERINDWRNQAMNEYRPILTNFLDPRQIFLIETVVGKVDDSFRYWQDGGYNQSERRRVIFAPGYFTPESQDYHIQLFEIKYPVKFATLSHGRILGTLINSGVDRSQFGDIITDGETWQFFGVESMASFFEEQIVKIGSINVRVEPVPILDAVKPVVDWQEESIVATSMRLDTIISETFNISRQRAKELVEDQRVQVNWSVNQHPDFQVDLLDMLSVRKFGRVQVLDVLGRTRKERYKLKIATLRRQPLSY
ncbi:RNA-binding protein S4 [Lapidilactobacillus concavus]|uniref:YlmH family RNA-binding protein n=1 Tax=Lapidilactobacillus concavus TaxID=287844 RepID=UPI000B1B57C4|nr:RNA-binding protein [Lapidilactobacillus concavus]GEL13030.1 RNA-binding protein S4 [Lapidilactobacillus concavus]